MLFLPFKVFRYEFGIDLVAVKAHKSDGDMSKEFDEAQQRSFVLIIP